ncbi:hypothetical protein [Actinophytocola sp.]|uniref:hypothetical protein n=1 Tax=Actinophytocola sp. TaxID=1872138 RepID=UPI002ED06C83
MSENNDDTDRVRLSQIFAGALAAVTAALIGSTMGVGGTVLGAGLASVISTVGGTVYLRSIRRTTESVRTVHAKVVGKSGGSTVLVTSEDPDAAPGAEVEADTSDEPTPEEPADRPPTATRRRWAVLAASTLAAFALGMVVVTGVEWLRGESLSGSEGTTFSSIVAPQNTGDRDENPSDHPTTSTTTPTTTTPEPTSTTTDPTTTTTTPPSESSTTTTTTTTPPVTTTTDEAVPGGTIPPSN